MTGKITWIVGGSITKQEDSAPVRRHRDLKTLLSRAGLLQNRKLAEECTELVSSSCFSATSEPSASSKKHSFALPQPGCAGCGGKTPASSGDSWGDHSPPCQLQSPALHSLQTTTAGSAESGYTILRKTNARAREMNLWHYLCAPHVCGALFPFNWDCSKTITARTKGLLSWIFPITLNSSSQFKSSEVLQTWLVEVHFINCCLDCWIVNFTKAKGLLILSRSKNQKKQTKPNHSANHKTCLELKSQSHSVRYFWQWKKDSHQLCYESQ